MVYDGAGATNADKLALYVDGELQSLAFLHSPFPSSTPAVHTDYTTLGSWHASGNFLLDGRLDETRLWTSARTEAEIQANMDPGAAPSGPDLLLSYSFDDGVPCGDNAAATVLADGSGNGYDGWLVGFALLDGQCESNYGGEAGPPDTDGDGVPDEDDACPDEDATGSDADGDGCIDLLSLTMELDDLSGPLLVDGVPTSVPGCVAFHIEVDPSTPDTWAPTDFGLFEVASVEVTIPSLGIANELVTSEIRYYEDGPDGRVGLTLPYPWTGVQVGGPGGGAEILDPNTIDDPLPSFTGTSGSSVGNTIWVAGMAISLSGGATLDVSGILTAATSSVSSPADYGACASVPDTDADDDGVDDVDDNCPDAANPDQADLDGDGLGDACDSDADGDGDPGASDCDDLDPSRYAGAVELCDDGIDNDCDGLVDVDDLGGDCDGDGIANGEDNCLFAYNPGQDDLDGDLLGDACDDDDDGDSVDDLFDNCPVVANADQADFDGDGAGDACDDDGDGDGVDDWTADLCHFTAPSDLDAGVPSRGLGKNRWADVDGDGTFDTSGKNPTGRSFTMDETAGCSCAQIIEICGYGNGHSKFGCSNSAMDTWTGLFDAAGGPVGACE